MYDGGRGSGGEKMYLKRRRIEVYNVDIIILGRERIEE